MTFELWKAVDRHDLIAEARAVCVAGGMLLVVGDDESDRVTAADVVEHLMRGLGKDPIRVREEAGRVVPVKQLLGRAWQVVDDPGSALQIPRSVAHARFMSGFEIVNEIAASLKASANHDRPFLFDTIDSALRVGRPEIGLFRELADKAQVPVVVFSRAESSSVASKTITRLEIGDMPTWEICNDLKAAEEFQAVDQHLREVLIHEIQELPSKDSRVVAVDAYDVLQAGLRGGS